MQSAAIDEMSSIFLLSSQVFLFFKAEGRGERESLVGRRSSAGRREMGLPVRRLEVGEGGETGGKREMGLPIRRLPVGREFFMGGMGERVSPAGRGSEVDKISWEAMGAGCRRGRGSPAGRRLGVGEAGVLQGWFTRDHIFIFPLV